MSSDTASTRAAVASARTTPPSRQPARRAPQSEREALPSCIAQACAQGPGGRDDVPTN